MADAARTVGAPFKPLAVNLPGGAIIAAATVVNQTNGTVFVFAGVTSDGTALFSVAPNSASTVPISQTNAITFSAPSATLGSVYVHIVDTPLTAQSSGNIVPAIRSNVTWSVPLRLYGGGAYYTTATLKLAGRTGSPPTLSAIVVALSAFTPNNPIGAHLWITEVSAGALQPYQYFMVGNNNLLPSAATYNIPQATNQGAMTIPGNGHFSYTNPIDLGPAVYSGAGGNQIAALIFLVNAIGSVTLPDPATITVNGYVQ